MGITVRAIDVGFGATKFVTASANGAVDCSGFPSLAFFDLGDKGTDPIGGKRKTALVPVDGLLYEVGPEVELAADRYRPRQLHDDYTETPEYRALTAGALHYMKVDTVDLLVLGLPVAQYGSKRTSLEKAMTGTFDLGKRRRIEVRRTLVVAQPQGALFDYATRNGQASIAKGTSLVIDVGSRTFDWLVTQGTKVIAKMSHSVTRGVSDVLMAIAARIGAEIQEEYRRLEAIDVALRTGKPLRIYQEEYDLKRYDKVVQKIADQAVLAMIQRMDGTHDVENIVLVGGGAYLFRKAIRRHFPKHTIHDVVEPQYANVRGFQLMGEKYVLERPDLFAGPGANVPCPSTRES